MHRSCSLKIPSGRKYFRYLLLLNKQRKEKKTSSFPYARLDQDHLQENPWNHSYAKLTVSHSGSLAVIML